MTDRPDLRPASPAAQNWRRGYGSDRRPATRLISRRIIVLLIVSILALVVESAAASAHGEVGHAGPEMAKAPFAVLLGLPVTVGLVGGIVSARYRSGGPSDVAGHRHGSLTSLVSIGLGAVFVLSAVSRGLSLAVVGVACGILAVRWVAARAETKGLVCGSPADLTLGAVSGHRLLEGVVVGAFYASGSAVGVLAALVVAGHTAVESAVIGRVYAPCASRAVGGVVLIHAGYLAGATVGMVAGIQVPGPLQVISLGIAGGVLIVVGVVGIGGGRVGHPAVDHETAPTGTGNELYHQ